MPPDTNELSWKDTVRVNAKTLTRILVPLYIWHGHILEHEGNEMMRPYEIHPATFLSHAARIHQLVLA